MSIWYPGSGLTYGEYLQAKSFVLDITTEVKSSNKRLEGRVTDQTQTLIANNAQLADQFGRGFDSINGTIEWGFNRLEYVLHDVGASIESLHSDFNYSIGLVLEAAGITNRLLTNVLGRLDAIHRTLESPTLTQAREFYRIGCQRLSKGLLDEALEAFAEAERKNAADFFIQFNMGKLCLYGIDDDNDVLDLQEAKSHLLLAGRFAKAEARADPAFAKLAAEALLHASIAAYAQSGEQDVLKDPVRAKQLLEEARRLASDAARLHPSLSEATYHYAKCCALLGESAAAIGSLEIAIAADRGYAVKVDIDHAFDSPRPLVVVMLSDLRDASGARSRSALQQVERFLADVLPWHYEKSALAGELHRYQTDLRRARDLISLQTYFGFLDAITLLDALVTSLAQLRIRRIDELRLQIEQLIQAAQVVLPRSGEYSAAVEDAIQEANDLIDQAEQQLGQETYAAFDRALSLAVAANAKASAGGEQARQEDAVVNRRLRRNAASSRRAVPGACYGALVGGAVMGFSGCISCLNNFKNAHSPLPDFNLFNGLFYGAVGGAVIGLVIGLTSGQMSD